ncbi:hypothetical protein ACHAXT_000899 [Thalassiosira profunda]
MPTPKKSASELEAELQDLLTAHEVAGHSVPQIEENYRAYESLRKKKKRRKKGLDRDERRHMKDLHPSWLMGSKIENKRRAVEAARRKEAREGTATASGAAGEDDEEEEPSQNRPRSATTSSMMDALLGACATEREVFLSSREGTSEEDAAPDGDAPRPAKKKKSSGKKSKAGGSGKKEAKPSRDAPPKVRPEPVLGRPRSMSDPELNVRLDDRGLLHVDGPAGWVGAYSPASRKVRLQRFREKREKRVWERRVKYDVRKNFAVSRLRVKGRFVKKEEEGHMRELMSLT